MVLVGAKSVAIGYEVRKESVSLALNFGIILLKNRCIGVQQELCYSLVVN